MLTDFDLDDLVNNVGPLKISRGFVKLRSRVLGLSSRVTVQLPTSRNTRAGFRTRLLKIPLWVHSLVRGLGDYVN